MSEANVIVVPETGNFTHSILHRNVVWINKSLGRPALMRRNANYLAPYWISGTETKGVNRLYHILGEVEERTHDFVIRLGNSFVLPHNWQRMNQHRRFEYHRLSSFGFSVFMPSVFLPVSDCTNDGSKTPAHTSDGIDTYAEPEWPREFLVQPTTDRVLCEMRDEYDYDPEADGDDTMLYNIGLQMELIEADSWEDLVLPDGYILSIEDDRDEYNRWLESRTRR